MGSWSDQSSSYFPEIWFTKSETENECKMSEETTGYKLYSTRDYMRCVCDFWGQDVDNCLVAVPDPEVDPGNDAMALDSLKTTAIVTLLYLLSF